LKLTKKGDKTPIKVKSTYVKNKDTYSRLDGERCNSDKNSECYIKFENGEEISNQQERQKIKASTRNQINEAVAKRAIIGSDIESRSRELFKNSSILANSYRASLTSLNISSNQVVEEQISVLAHRDKSIVYHQNDHKNVNKSALSINYY
jgi:hypothetical protein